jgi:hypothetical protein
MRGCSSVSVRELIGYMCGEMPYILLNDKYMIEIIGFLLMFFSITEDPIYIIQYRIFMFLQCISCGHERA